MSESDDPIVVPLGNGDPVVVPFGAGDPVVVPMPNVGPPGKGVPEGGDFGQHLVKATGDDYDTKWVPVDVVDLSGYVETTDPRLEDERDPNPHTHAQLDVDDLVGDLGTIRSDILSKGTSDLELGTTSTTALAGNTTIPSTPGEVGAQPVGDYALTSQLFDGEYTSLTEVPDTFPPIVGTGSDEALAGDTVIPSTPGEVGAQPAGDYATGVQGSKADTAVQGVQAGSNVTVDNTDPLNPKVSAEDGSQWDDVPGGLNYADGDVTIGTATNYRSKLAVDGDIQGEGLYSSDGNANKYLGFNGNDFVYSTYGTHTFKLYDGSAYSPIVTIDKDDGMTVEGDIRATGTVEAANLVPERYYRDGADYALLGTNNVTQSNSNQTVKFLANFVYFWLIKPVEDIGITGIKCGYVQVPQPDAKFRIWLYETDASIPVGPPLMDSGDLDGSAMAYRSATFARVDLKAGKYYAAAIVTNNHDLAFRGVADAYGSSMNGPWISLGAHNAPASPALTLRGIANYGPAPATPPNLATINNAPPLVYWTTKR